MPTYRIIGADGKEYGPISVDQMRQWVTEGRVNMQTRVLVEGTTDWKTVADLPEFAKPVTPAPGFGAPLPPPPGSQPAFPTMPTTPAYGSAADQVNGPGIALIILGAINIILSLGRMALTLAGLGMSTMANTNTSNEMEKAALAFFGTFGMALLAVGLIGGLVILFGGIKMRNFQNYGLCMTASILAMIPCLSCCFLIGIPIGIWALVVLSKPEVKNLFR